MKKYTIVAMAAVLASCGGNNEDAKEFEKKQANIAKEIAAAQQAKAEDTPCAWAGLAKGCSMVTFEGASPLYAVKGETGDILVSSASKVKKVSHHNFTNYVSKIAKYAISQGKSLGEDTIKSAPVSYSQTQRGYLITVELPMGKVFVLEDGRIMGKLK